MTSKETAENARRKNARRAVDIPVLIGLEDLVIDQKEYINNVSVTGLSFRARVAVSAGTPLRIRIPLLRPIFEARARVIWCQQEGDSFRVGAEFEGHEDRFKLRMFEQICCIEKFKREIFESEGRLLTGEEAALEWIRRYADSFPPPGALEV